MRIRNREIPTLFVVLAAGLAIRIAISPFFSDHFDFAFWSSTVFDVRTGDGIYRAYDFWYPPVWGYVISLMVPVLDLFNCTPLQELLIGMSEEDLSKGDGWASSIGAIVILKAPLIVADIIDGLLIYRIAMRLSGDERKSLAACALWVFNPLAIWMSSGHGMFDTLSLLFILLSVQSYLDRHPLGCGIFIATATLTKVFPAFLVFPLLALILVWDREKRFDMRSGGLYVLGGVGMSIFILLPQIINGELQFVVSFFTERMFGSYPTTSGFDPTAMSFFSDQLFPRTGRSEPLLPSFLLALVISAFILVRRCSKPLAIVLLTVTSCFFLMWPMAPGYPQYYVPSVGLLCLCACIDRRFGYISLITGIVCLAYLITCFEYAAPMVTMGLLDVDTLYDIHHALDDTFGIFSGFNKVIRTVPMIAAVTLSFILCRRCADEA